MHNCFKLQLAMLIAALPVTAMAQTQNQQENQNSRAATHQKDHSSAMKRAQQHIGPERLSKQIGKTVYGVDNKKIGVIEDLVLDAGNDRISYAVLSFGGFMGMGDKYFAIPWSSMEHRSNKKDGVYVDISPEQLKKAPGFDKDNWPNTASPDFRNTVDKYYGVNQETRSDWYARNKVQRLDENGRKHGDDNHKNHTLNQKNDTATNANATENEKDGNAPSQVGPRENGLVWSRRVSTIIGTDVRNSKNQNIGEIKDLIVNPRTGDIKYAVLSFGGVMGIGDKLYYVPMNRLQTSAMDQQFVLDVTKQTLENAKGFDEDNWPDMNDAKFKDDVERTFKDVPARPDHHMNRSDMNRANMNRRDLKKNSDQDMKKQNEKNDSDKTDKNDDNQDDM